MVALEFVAIVVVAVAVFTNVVTSKFVDVIVFVAIVVVVVELRTRAFVLLVFVGSDERSVLDQSKLYQFHSDSEQVCLCYIPLF